MNVLACYVVIGEVCNARVGNCHSLIMAILFGILVMKLLIRNREVVSEVYDYFARLMLSEKTFILINCDAQSLRFFKSSKLSIEANIVSIRHIRKVYFLRFGK